MSDRLLSPQEEGFRKALNAISPSGYEKIEELGSMARDSAFRIACIIVEYSCQSQHVGNIIAGRNAFRRLPIDWVKENIDSVIKNSVNLNDSWEFRRLLELLRDGHKKALGRYIEIGNKSSDDEIKEASSDFIGKGGGQ